MWQSGEEGGRSREEGGGRREVKIELRARMLVGSKSDDMVIVKVTMPYILTLHLSDPDSNPIYPLPSGTHGGNSILPSLYLYWP